MRLSIDELILEMTLGEKIALCSGSGFWHTKAIERLGIPSIMMTDGPHGLRKQEGGADHMGINKSLPSTCFPTAASLACSWDAELVKKVGIAIGEEAQAERVSIVLGPGANIKRSPLCGRNFEYFSEDPYLSANLAIGHIVGLQSQGVGASLKHFAVNNQEHKRMSIDTIVDERTLREIYLASFESVVKEAKPWTVMCAYNKVNGDFCSENKILLTDVLKDEWGFSGLVVSDWGAVNQRDDGLIAGLDLEMPTSSGLGEKKILAAIESGKISEIEINQAVERILKVIFKAFDNKKDLASYNIDLHHQLARQVSRECMVLLKNEDNILPIKKDDKIAIIGALAQNPRYQGAGSSYINPTKVDNFYEELKKTVGNEANISYAEGYKIYEDELNNNLFQEALEVSKEADVVVFFAGLPDRYESEGFDRKHISIPLNQSNLIDAIARVHSNIIVVLSNGAPIEMPWLTKAKGVIEGYLGGQAFGGAIADILLGNANPCGKLAETFPKKLSHNPSYMNFPGEDEQVQYKEGVFVGYRHYDTRDIEPLFPFGYGLSYTSFAYSDIVVDKKIMSDNESLTVSVRVKNTGILAGKEIVQLYVKDIESTVMRPEKELKGFKKIFLEPGEEKKVTFTLDKRSFAYYNVRIKDWHVETGSFEILLGRSSREILLKEEVSVNSTVMIEKKLTRHSTIGELMINPAGAEIIKAMFGESFSNNKDSEVLGGNGEELIKSTVLRAIVAMSGDAFTEEMLDGILKQVNSVPNYANIN